MKKKSADGGSAAGRRAPSPAEESLWEQMGKAGFQSGSAVEGTAPEDLNRIPDAGSLAGHPYLPFLHKLEKPGRYTGGELHSVVKERADHNIVLAFPDAYELGMSHLGYRILYSHLNDMPDVRAERVYTPWFDLEAELRRRELPLVTLESRTPLREFDCVGFSLQYELTFTNVLTMLDLGGIPLRSVDRGEDDPLILAGGPVAFQPEPLAPFIDAYLIGDGERYFAETVREWVRLGRAGRSRSERLRGIAGRPGIYVPSLYRLEMDERNDLTVVAEPLFPEAPATISRAHIPDLNEYPFPEKFPVPSTEIVFDRASVEIARGCTEGCRFCQAGMIYRPVRERSPEQIRQTVFSSVKCGGFEEISLTSLSTADYSAVQPLVKGIMPTLREENVSLSVSSLRAYGLTEEMLDEINSVKNTSLTFAPEAGTQRMRDVVNKNISQEAIVASAHRVFSRSWRKMKCYFMIGLPTEEDADVYGIADLAKLLLGIARKYIPKNRVEIVISVSSHVPKPFTPFQWAAQDDMPEIERKQQILKDETRAPGLSLRWHDPRTSHLEGILGRGDRPLADVIEAAWRKGARFDAWADRLRFDLWLEAIEELGVDRHKYLRTLPVDGRLPWDHIDCGVERSFLLKEYRKALRDRVSPPCGKPFGKLRHHTSLEDAQEETKKLVCFNCGIACDMTRMKEERIEHLAGLGAHRIGEPAPLAGTEEDVELAVAAASERKRVFGKRRPQREGDARPTCGYRFRYAKTGAARFVGHLDLLRILPRAFRRAGLGLARSAGFKPKPLFSFGPPLRLGMSGLGEIFDVRLTDRLPAAEILERVNERLPDGIVLRGGHELREGAPKLSRVTAWADYLLFFPAESYESIREPFEQLLPRGAPMPFERWSRKKERWSSVDLSQGLERAAQRSSLPGDVAEFLDVPPDHVVLELRLGLQGEEMVRPEEVIWLLSEGRMPEGLQVARRRLLPRPSRVPTGA